MAEVNEPLSDERLREIRERAEKATPGPMEVNERGGGTMGYDIDRIDDDAPGLPNGMRGYFERQEDAEFYAAAREDVPALLREIDRLKAQLKEMAIGWDTETRMH